MLSGLGASSGAVAEASAGWELLEYDWSVANFASTALSPACRASISFFLHKAILLASYKHGCIVGQGRPSDQLSQ